MIKPLFSIIIPSYNRAGLISKTLQSIFSQTYESYEVIVVDDGGHDETEKIVKDFANAQVRYFYKENGERGAARNYGVSKASGQFVTFLDSDDILYPKHLEEAVNFLNKHPQVLCFAHGYEIKKAENNKIIREGYLFRNPTINKEIIKGNFLSCFGVFITKEIFNELRFEEDRKFAGTEDWLLWLQLAARYPFYYNNVITGALIEHNNRSVLSFNEESLEYRSNILKARLEEDEIFTKVFGLKQIRKIYAHMLSYTSLHLALSNKKRRAIAYWFKAVRFNKHELITKRSFAITRKIFFS